MHLFHSSLDQPKSEVNFDILTWDWRNKFVNYLQHEILPKDEKQSQHLQIQVDRCCLVEGNL